MSAKPAPTAVPAAAGPLTEVDEEDVRVGPARQDVETAAL